MTDCAPSSPRHAWILGLLCLGFAARVMGQAMQRWWPQEFLPPFDSFQGSRLPYFVLLPVQLGILTWMIWTMLGVARGYQIRSERFRTLLTGGGVAYMSGSLLRIAVGLFWNGAPAWFGAWVPAIFHVVLAAFVITLAHYHSWPNRSYGVTTS